MEEMPVHHRARKYGDVEMRHSNDRVILDLVTVKFLAISASLQLFGPIRHPDRTGRRLITTWLAYVKLVEGQSIGNRPLLFDSC